MSTARRLVTTEEMFTCGKCFAEGRGVQVLRPDIESMLWIAATRYYLGRMTADVGEFCAHLIGAWSRLDNHTREVIARDIRREFERDDEARHVRMHDPGSRIPLSLGADVDRREWEKVRDHIGASHE